MHQGKPQYRSNTQMLTASEIAELRRKAEETGAYAAKAFGLPKRANSNHGFIRRMLARLRVAIASTRELS
ncbi:MAG: hypothetical protein JWQ49_1892 [Edaphobacter sp.]|nr:hypothetical protein [Edaphobacter sp.]